jgi:hypothetical protein
MWPGIPTERCANGGFDVNASKSPSLEISNLCSKLLIIAANTKGILAFYLLQHPDAG